MKHSWASLLLALSLVLSPSIAYISEDVKIDPCGHWVVKKNPYSSTKGIKVPYVFGCAPSEIATTPVSNFANPLAMLKYYSEGLLGTQGKVSTGYLAGKAK